jgi:2-polyprenyl-3-methyl-5-hydroxy-6-metoxy-1,4-benzoquinol methylase
MSANYIERKTCRMCGAESLEMDLQLQSLPIGDRYTSEKDKDLTNEVYPMEIMRCETCGHYQNSGFVKPEKIYVHYLSRPATTNSALSGAYQEYADYLLSEFKPSNTPFSVETGSNDGAFSAYMKEKGCKVLCVEPSPNLVKQANERGIPTTQNYFSEKLSEEIKSEHGEADYFIANHMFANVDDSEDFIKGVKNLLSENGVFSMQTFYQVDVIEKNLVENFTHEHLSCFYIKPFVAFCERFGMQVFDVKRVPAKAGSIRCFVQKQGGSHAVQASVKALIDLENSMGMGQKGAHDSVRAFIESTKKNLHAVLDPALAEGKKVVGFGTSIGATTFIFNYDLGDVFTYLVDDDPYRHNLVSPHFHIPVLSSAKIHDDMPEYIVVLAPLYADIIIKKNQDYLAKGGKFIKFWPKFEIVESVEEVVS